MLCCRHLEFVNILEQGALCVMLPRALQLVVAVLPRLHFPLCCEEEATATQVPLAHELSRAEALDTVLAQDKLFRAGGERGGCLSRRPPGPLARLNSPGALARA